MSGSASAGAERDALANHKRRAYRSVQEAREKLTYKSGGKPEFEYELLLMFVRNELSAAVTTPLLAIIVAMGAMFWAPPRELLIWLGTVFVAKGILISLCRQFIRAPRDDSKTPMWRAKITAAEFLYGVSWAAVAFISPHTQSEAAHTFIFASMLVVISMRMLFASTVMPIVYAGTLPMTVAIVIRFSLLDNPFYWAMAAMAVGVHIYFIWLMSGLNSTVVAMLEFRAEKDALIAELEQSKSISDEARARAEEANLAKSRFLATMSHELRTPLNAILGFSEIMRAEILGPHANPTYKEYAADIHQSGQHLLNLINEILDISRIEAGRYELHEAPIDLAELVEDCHRLMRLRAESKGLKIVEAFEEDLPQLWADERAIRQICLNLLSNAIKFTPSGGTIALKVGRTGDRRSVPQREGHRPRHSRERDPARVEELRPGFARASDRGRRHRARPAHHQGTDRAARRRLRAEEQAALRHRGDHHLPAQARDGGAAPRARTRRAADRAAETRHLARQRQAVGAISVPIDQASIALPQGPSTTFPSPAERRRRRAF